VAGFFTYTLPLTLTAFDAASNIVATDVSDFASNLALSGDPGSAPNELLSVAFAGGIDRVLIAGDFAGGSFTLDDLTRTPATAVSEPATLMLLASALAGMAAWTRRRL
jgi:hypothetical protein